MKFRAMCTHFLEKLKYLLAYPSFPRSARYAKPLRQERPRCDWVRRPSNKFCLWTNRCLIRQVNQDLHLWFSIKKRKVKSACILKKCKYPFSYSLLRPIPSSTINSVQLNVWPINIVVVPVQRHCTVDVPEWNNRVRKFIGIERYSPEERNIKKFRTENKNFVLGNNFNVLTWYHFF